MATFPFQMFFFFFMAYKGDDPPSIPMICWTFGSSVVFDHLRPSFSVGLLQASGWKPRLFMILRRCEEILILRWGVEKVQTNVQITRTSAVATVMECIYICIFLHTYINIDKYKYIYIYITVSSYLYREILIIYPPVICLNFWMNMSLFPVSSFGPTDWIQYLGEVIGIHRRHRRRQKTHCLEAERWWVILELL